MMDRITYHIDTIINDNVCCLLEHIIPESIPLCKTAYRFARVFRDMQLICQFQTPRSTIAHIQYSRVFLLQYKSKRFGVIGFAFFETGKQFTEEELRLLQYLVDFCSGFIAGCFQLLHAYYCLEITQQAQKKMFELSQHKLFSFAKKTQIGIWEYNAAADTYTVGTGFYVLHGTTMTQEAPVIPFDTYLEKFVFPDDRWKLKQLRQRILSGELFDSKELWYRIIRKDGIIRHVMTQRFFEKKDADTRTVIYGFIRDITDNVNREEERRRQKRHLKQTLYYDSVTNLPNRRYLHKWLNQEMKRTRSEKNSGIVFFINLDDLKMINDTYGHMCGDQVIAITGTRIREAVDRNIFVSHLGSDEFVAVLRGAYTRADIRSITEKIQYSIHKRQPLAGLYVHMTASIGIAVYPEDGNTAEEILKNADNAMCDAKGSGKDQYRFYTPSMQRMAFEKIHLIENLYEALQKHELFLVYQPQIDAVTDEIVSFEALLRWNSTVHGCVMPGRFIPLAEQSGLINTIGKWVLQEVCRFLQRLLAKGWKVRIDVNVSPKQLMTDNFVADTLDTIQEFGVPFQYIGFELTESMCFADAIPMKTVIEKFTRLTTAGIHNAMDDFGTGYSSLTLLNELPFDTVKLDKSFIDKIGTNVHETEFVASIIDMIHSLHIQVVAEGVETEQQLAYLRSKGCDYIQGYVFSRPLQEQDVMRLLMKQDVKRP